MSDARAADSYASFRLVETKKLNVLVTNREYFHARCFEMRVREFKEPVLGFKCSSELVFVTCTSNQMTNLVHLVQRYMASRLFEFLDMKCMALGRHNNIHAEPYPLQCREFSRVPALFYCRHTFYLTVLIPATSGLLETP